MKKLILTALLAAAAASASAAGNDRISRLEAEIQELKQRISVLEKQQGIAAPRTPAAAPAPAAAPQPGYRQPEKAVEAPAAQAQTPRTPAAAPVLQSEAEAEAAAAGPALPNSIYAPPPPSQTAAAPPPQPVGPNSARFYSVHRDYGLTPDAIPVAPEVFGPTADLTQPETPDAPTSRKGASKGAVNADRLAQAADGPSSN